MTRVGMLLPTFDPMRVGAFTQVLDAARLSEALGFDAVWAGDHLQCPAPGLDAVAAIAATAAATSRVTLGFAVMLLGARQPAWTAKQLITIDTIAPGRLALGVGAGGEFEAEFQAAWAPVNQRGRRLDETLALLPALLGGQPVDHAGTAMELHAPPLLPAASRMPPIYVGGRGEPAMRRAARFGDYWLPMWLSPDKLRHRAERLAELAAEHGRRRPELGLLLGVHVDEDLDRAREQATAYIHGQYGMPFDRVEHWTAYGSPERVAEYLSGHVEAGVSEFVLMPLSDDCMTQIERCAEVRRLILGTAKIPPEKVDLASE
jgi:alkanesulfonate monooxygenase SsuD/methylene tetrahydromethanopterin reductase-like flavin-dependent oxidoreductase (luciferase family)